MAWTDEMVEGLKKMWKQGLTTNENWQKIWAFPKTLLSAKFTVLT